MRTPLKTIALAATFGLAVAFTLSYGQWSWSEGEGESGDSYTDIGPGVAPNNITVPSSSSAANSQVKVIVGPLLKTKWGSGDHPNPFLWIACQYNGTAQIMKFHNYPPRGVAGGYQDIEFDWNNMLDTYKGVNATEQQKKAITTLVHSLKLGGYEMGIGGEGDVFAKNLGYDKSIQKLINKYYGNISMVAPIVRSQLDSGLPVYVGGTNSKDGGKSYTQAHGFVIDGYDSKGRFHVNWGWGGAHDGYYPIDSLTPGKKSLEDGYHHDYRIIINIQPDKGGVGSNVMALDSFAVGKTSAGQYESFNIHARTSSLGIFPGGQAGTALVDNNGNIAKVIGIKSFNNQYNSYNINAIIPEDVSPGQYTLRIVTRIEGGEWKIATLSDKIKGIPTAIDFTVNR